MNELHVFVSVACLTLESVLVDLDHDQLRLVLYFVDAIRDLLQQSDIASSLLNGVSNSLVDIVARLFV